MSRIGAIRYGQFQLGRAGVAVLLRPVSAEWVRVSLGRLGADWYRKDGPARARQGTVEIGSNGEFGPVAAWRVCHG